MTSEVDQSIKVERTNQDTIIGIATKGKEFTAAIPGKVKRQLQIEFGRAGQPRLFVYRTFITAVVITLQKSGWKNITDVVIDVEYSGHERRLRSIFLEMWSRFSDSVPDITFREIGKRSPAHQACYAVTIGDAKPNIILKFGELKWLALK